VRAAEGERDASELTVAAVGLMPSEIHAGPATLIIESYLAAVADSSDDAIAGARLDGIVETWNKGAEKLFGYAAAEIRGRNVGLIEPPEPAGEISGVLEGIARGSARNMNQDATFSFTMEPEA